MRLLIAAIALTAFAGAAAEEAKDQTLPSGLIYRSLKEGSGASPKPSDVVKVHYRGTLQSNGKEFDSSYSRGQPLEFPLQGVIKCWTEGLQKMKVGGKARLVCPPQIAYGSRAMGDVIPANSTLVFEVELLDIRK
jgi:FKBP-type peptidyl-prolyl cis-trans isomerase FkpA